MALISKSISRSRLYHFVQKRSNKTFIPFDSVCQNLILIKFFKFEFFIVSLLPLDRLILKFFRKEKFSRLMGKVRKVFN